MKKDIGVRVQVKKINHLKFMDDVDVLDTENMGWQGQVYASLCQST